nr:uncharacterized protein LOC102453409 isoform X2 [Pelodiscus sinensis]XP_025040180.1 uncharacterized protein LOC102453409 isoform X2 [Pelodiscus sinensis]XP_025040181.1 uncharacterized protein LOC102453409 isoform X2 [Pelodiscus sinensis]|eukprot:XP_006122631.1 uncharacterized protein LOC102453409 isoform X2 [Pelodiscus sinensis]
MGRAWNNIEIMDGSTARPGPAAAFGRRVPNVQDVGIYVGLCSVLQTRWYGPSIPLCCVGLSTCTTKVREVDIPMCTVGDTSYPFLSWLMKLYMGHLDPTTEQFNAKFRRCLIMAEGAFGCLRGRFLCLLTHLDPGNWNNPQVVVACCVLHNLGENKGDMFPSGWGAKTEWLARAFEQPCTAAIRQTQGACAHLGGPEGEFQPRPAVTLFPWASP